MSRLVGIVLTIGAILFFAALFMPGVADVFGTEDKAEQIAAIEDNRTGWNAGMVLFSLGGLVSAIGIGFFGRHVQAMSDDRNIRTAANIAGAAALLGVITWLIIGYDRITQTAQELVNNEQPEWQFHSYTILTLLAMFIVGYILWRTGYSRWLAGFVLVYTAFHTVRYILSGDSIPAEHYIPILIMGIVLTIWPGTSAQAVALTPATEHS